MEGTGSEVDLLDIVDVRVIQHITALGQKLCKCSELVQHGQSPFDN